VALDTGLALILGGAAGNIIDRVQQGSVIDFIDLHLGHWHWPAFNVADIAISAGAVLLVADLLGLFSGKDRGPTE
jgi:signal peptidase II